MQIDSSSLARFINENRKLKDYVFEIEATRRYKPYTFTPEEEKRLGNLVPALWDWQYELYQNIIKDINFTKVKTREGEELNVWTQRGAIMNNSDTNVREAGFKSRISDFAQHRDLFAFILIKTIKGRNALAQAYTFNDYPDESYFDRYLDTYSSLLSLLARSI